VRNRRDLIRSKEKETQDHM